jgi:DNA repair protein RAD5
MSDNLIAVNIFLDGGLNTYTAPRVTPASTRNIIPFRPDLNRLSPSTSQPESRYIGAFGVTGWATLSGTGLLAYGDYVKIERSKPTTGLKKPGRGAQNHQSVIVRFTTEQGKEIGRLENSSASWISSLMDLGVCKFHGTCVYAPEHIRTNDNVFLQLRCYLLYSAFKSLTLSKLDSNRDTGLFETKETTEERDLRLRQVALLRLFQELNLEPASGDRQKEKQKREALIQQAEATEELLGQQVPSSTVPGLQPSSLPEEEDGKELEQDQLDSLYKKAQSFDFNTPELDPPSTFVLQLRKYQKQALYWMVGKEKNEEARTEGQSMHPLWDAYTFPTKDVDDMDVLVVKGQESFYINEYSGELSLDFPVQEQNCLGGILADGMYFIKQHHHNVLTRYRNGPWQDDRNAEPHSYEQSRLTSIAGSAH